VIERLRRSADGASDSTSGELPFDDGALEARMCWILGSERSGSTWLLRMLGHPMKLNADHPVGFIPPRRDDFVADVIPVNESYLPNHIAPMVAAQSQDPLAIETLNDRFAAKPTYFFSPDYREVWEPELRRLALVRLHGIVTRAVEAGVRVTPTPALIVKEVNGAYAAEPLMSLFPRGRLLFLVRDGRDVVDSMLHALSPGGWIRRGGSVPSLFERDEERRAWLPKLCGAWIQRMRAIGRAYEAHSPELRRQVRYEDLLADPRAELAGLVDWLGLAHGERWVERAVSVNSFEAMPDERKGPTEFFRAAEPGLWRESFAPEEQELMHELMGPELRALGYET